MDPREWPVIRGSLRDRDWSDGVMKRWSIGVMEYWSDELMEVFLFNTPVLHHSNPVMIQNLERLQHYLVSVIVP
jgi:hypothetical protein